jgi:hypothetical protein
MNNIPAELGSIDTDPEWHLLDVEIGKQVFKLVRLKEADYREAIFLDARFQTNNYDRGEIPISRLHNIFPQRVSIDHPAAYIFHIGHCGSTLLSRVLSVSRSVLPLREPMTLTFLANQQRILGQPVCQLDKARYKRLGIMILCGLERRFENIQLPIIKAKSICNNLIGPVLKTHANRRAILMYVPFASFITGNYKYRMVSPDLRRQARSRMEDWMNIPGAPALHLSQLTMPQLSGLTWLSNMHALLKARKEFGSQVLLIDFEDFLHDPSEYLAQITDFLGLEHEQQEIIDGYGKIAMQYSKMPGKAYSAQTRLKEMERAREDKHEQIKLGLEWVRSIIQSTPALAECADFLE